MQSAWITAAACRSRNMYAPDTYIVELSLLIYIKCKYIKQYELNE